ncbi:MAG: hypothetical protein DCC73_15045 [Proteobacteria bacterium]|nr:MAG: hypothetical protein DCC73_15045 [Pseudomonadota bacterium]
MSREQIEKLLVQIDATTEGLRRELAKADASTAKFQNSVDTMTAKVDKAFSGLAAGVKGLAGAWATTKIFGFVKSSLEAASSLGELAEQLGVTTDLLQTMQYASSQVGVKNEEMERGVARLTDRIGEAADGNETAIAAFDRLGVAYKDAAGNARDTGVVIYDVADAIAALPTPAERAAAVTDLLGRSGQKLLTIFTGGAEGLRRFAREAKELGLNLDQAKIDEADAAMDKLAQTMLRLKVHTAGVVAGPLTDMIEKLDELAQWADENPRLLTLLSVGSAVALGAAAGGRVGGATGAVVGGAAGLAAAGWVMTGDEDRGVVEIGPLGPSIPTKSASSSVSGVDINSPGQFSVTPNLDDFDPARRGTALRDFFAGQEEAAGRAEEAIRQLEAELLKVKDPIAVIEARAREEIAAYEDKAAQGIISEERLASARSALNERATREIAALKAAAQDQLHATEMAFWRLVDPVTALEMEARDAVKAFEDLYKQGLITERQFQQARANINARTTLEAGAEFEKDTANPLLEAMQRLDDRMDQMWVDMISQGKFTFKSLGEIARREFLAAFTSELFIKPFRSLMADLFSSIFGAPQKKSGGLFTSIFSSIAASFGGARADGGPVTAGVSYLVGERGRELFVPRVSGAIVPNHKLGGGVTINIDARQATDPAAVRLQVMEGIQLAMPQITARATAATMTHLTRPRLA